MVMSIKDAKSHIKYGIIENNYPLQRDLGIEACNVALDTMNKYQILQADYENHLKADLVAMLTDIQLEIKELWDNRYDVWLDNQYYIGKNDTLEEVDDIIQQKINSLKENKNESY